MKCPYCDSEMEKGRVLASATGSIPVVMLEWYAEKDFEKKGLMASLKKKGIYIKDTKDGYFRDSYHCSVCGKVFAEFPTNEKQK